MDVVYAMPGQDHRLFINVVHACPNACLFCVDFKGDSFFGFDLKGSRAASVSEIVAAVERLPDRSRIREVYYCGIGEPLLLYDRVTKSACMIRGEFSRETTFAINTSGTFFIKHPRVDFAKYFGLIQVSLNAENEEKYDLICRPKIKGAFGVLMEFLHALHGYIARNRLDCRVELSVVDMSEVEKLPAAAQALQNIPRPDVEACRRIAAGFGWPLKVKALIEESESVKWAGFASQARGG